MSSYAEFRVRGKSIFSFRNDITPNFLFLFTPDNVVKYEGEVAKHILGEYPDYEEDDYVVYLLRATVSELRDRLAALGIGRAAIAVLYHQLRDEYLEPSTYSIPESLLDYYNAKTQF